MAAGAGVKQTEVLPPQNDRKASFIRESLTDGPDWRWRKASAENYCARSDRDFICSSDAYVVFAKRVQWLLGTPELRVWLQEKWPSVYDIITVATDDKYSNMKSELNSTLIRVHDIDDLCTEVAWINHDQARLYSKWFFDLSGICAISSWIEDQIIKPLSRKRYNGGKELNDILLAYFCNKKYNMAHSYNTEERATLKMLRDNRRLNSVLSYVFDDKPVDPEIMEQIIDKFDTSKSGDTGSDVLDKALTTRLEEVTRRRTAEEEYNLFSDNQQGVEHDDELNYIRQRITEANKTS